MMLEKLAGYVLILQMNQIWSSLQLYAKITLAVFCIDNYQTSLAPQTQAQRSNWPIMWGFACWQPLGQSYIPLALPPSIPGHVIGWERWRQKVWTCCSRRSWTCPLRRACSSWSTCPPRTRWSGGGSLTRPISPGQERCLSVTTSRHHRTLFPVQNPLKRETGLPQRTCTWAGGPL